MKRIATLASVVIVTVVFCAITGCGKEASENSAEDAEAKVNTDSGAGSMTIKSKDGEEDVEIQMDRGGMRIKSKDGEVVSTYSADGETYTMTTEGGGPSVAIGKGAKLPEGFPKDVPVFEGLEIQIVSADPESNSFTVQGISTEPTDKVAEFYRKEMKSQGWNESEGMTTTGQTPMHMLNFEKDDRTAAIVVMSQEGKTSVSIATGTN